VIGFGSIGLPTSLAGTSASQRGPGMPAVLLSAPTHRNARLHIHNSPEDFFGASLTETGSANILRAWYHGQLRARLPAFVPAPAAPTAPSATSAPAAGPVVPTAAPAAPAATPLDFVAAEDAGPMAMQAYIANRPANVTEAAQRQRIADGIEHAMKATYARIRDFMQPRLRTGLYTAERQYYRTAAEGAGHASSSAHQLTPMQVSRVFSAAVARNTQVLETDNHWA
jgi:hypothetical protein